MLIEGVLHIFTVSTKTITKKVENYNSFFSSLENIRVLTLLRMNPGVNRLNKISKQVAKKNAKQRTKRS